MFELLINNVTCSGLILRTEDPQSFKFFKGYYYHDVGIDVFLDQLKQQLTDLGSTFNIEDTGTRDNPGVPFKGNANLPDTSHHWAIVSFC